MTAFSKDYILHNSEYSIKEGDLKMGSNSKQTKAIRYKKARPNKKNLKKNLERVQKNAAILRELASESEA